MTLACRNRGLEIHNPPTNTHYIVMKETVIFTFAICLYIYSAPSTPLGIFFSLYQSEFSYTRKLKITYWPGRRKITWSAE